MCNYHGLTKLAQADILFINPQWLNDPFGRVQQTSATAENVYRAHPAATKPPTKQELLDYATKIDRVLGSTFDPPR